MNKPCIGMDYTYGMFYCPQEFIVYSSGLGDGGSQMPLSLLYLTDTISREGQPTMGSAWGSPDSLGEGLDEV